MLTSGQVRDRILKRTSEVGILCIAAVACPPSRVNGELLQIGEPAVLWHAGYPAGWQNGEVAQIDGLRALRCQIIVEKLMMADLVVGVVGDVLRHGTVALGNWRAVVFRLPERSQSAGKQTCGDGRCSCSESSFLEK